MVSMSEFNSASSPRTGDRLDMSLTLAIPSWVGAVGASVKLAK